MELLLIRTWNFINSDSEKPNQETVLQNFDAMSGYELGRRALLLAELKDVRGAQRPQAGQNVKPFMIADWAAQGQAIISNEGGDEDKRESFLPHLLYLFETEGRKIPPEVFVREKNQNEISILMIGEPLEWEALKRDVALESRFDLINKFEIFELHSPDAETRLELPTSNFSSRNKRS